MRFGVLGPLTVWTDDGRPVKIPEVKVRALLADLLAHEGRPVSADRLVDDLWGRRPPRKPANTLQTKVSHLRRALEGSQPGGRGLVVHQPPGYLLRIDAGAVDAQRFRDLAGRARETDEPRARAALLSDALALWRGPAFADFGDEEFTRPAIRQLEEQRLTALEDQAEARLALGEHSLLVGELGDLVARHPLRERLRAAQLRALYRAGRQSEALESYGELRDRLAGELGLDPGPELVALHRAILRQDPALDPVPGLAAPAVRPRTNLPVPLTGLVGRDDAVAEVRSLLESGRLVTLTGPGGVGKTRLAIEVAQLLSRTGGVFPDGVRIVELAGLSRSGAPDTTHPPVRPAEPPEPPGPPGPPGPPEPTGLPGPSRPSGSSEPAEVTEMTWVAEPAEPAEVTEMTWVAEPAEPAEVTKVTKAAEAAEVAEVTRVAEAVAVALDIRDDTGPGPFLAGRPAPLVDRLAEALRARRLLLVLDNCEHVIEPVSELARLLLRAAPDLRVLATSREPLGLAGELLWPVAPLEPPDPAADADPASVRRSGAARLFVARAAAAMPGFTLDAGNARAVAVICRRLDGIPLALELAATRVRALGVHELADRLDDRFRLLATGHRGAPARQRTLRAMIDWSWELLTAPERIVLRRLAVHADGCTLQAAEEVCAGDGVRAAEVADLLARLVDRSLVVVADGARGPRYRLLESIAAYCVERLHEMDDFEGVKRRHVHHYTTLAERAEPHLYGHDQRRWLELLDAEAANLRVALDSSVRHGDPRPALRLVNAMAHHWLLRGRFGEGRRSLGAALAVGGEAPAAARARAVAWEVGFSLLAGEDTDRAARSRTALALCDDAGDPGVRAGARWSLGFALFNTGDLTASEDLANDALAGFGDLEDRWGVAAALSLKARQAMLRGDLVALGRDGERSAALFRELGDRWGQLQTVHPLASLAEISGDHERAARLCRDGLRMAEELGLWPEVSFLLSGLGRITLLTGDRTRARELHERALRLAAEQGFKFGEIYAEIGLGLGARREGRLDDAETHLCTVLEWYRRETSESDNALVLAELGFVAEQRGDAVAARALHLDGFAAARDIGDPRAMALALEGLAGAQALAGRHRHAARLLGAAAAARQGAGAPLPPVERGDVDRIAAAARKALGGESFAAEFGFGGGLKPEEARSVAEAS
ncbi:BTAD domain-containing putative transcriptional regulator [Streptosporangium sp. CA-135522]|uniref:BTAD domain-containing putative transcriptional regulator n=1 Tax=Streptosporangium sp. CA-135522 TaxID=3240072 RepID=UPI003D8ADDC8